MSLQINITHILHENKARERRKIESKKFNTLYHYSVKKDEMASVEKEHKEIKSSMEVGV